MKSCEHDDHLTSDQDSTALNCCHSGCKVRCRRKRQYRTTSPSYQAVEMEYDQLSRFREFARDSEEPLNIFGWNPDRPNREIQDYTSPPSSPQHSSGGSISDAASPNHSSVWSDYGSDVEESETIENQSSFPSSPSSDFFETHVNSDSSSTASPAPPSEISSVFSPALLVCSDIEDEMEENETVCYSPAIADFDFDCPVSLPSSNPQLPCNKKRKYV